MRLVYCTIHLNLKHTNTLTLTTTIRSAQHPFITLLSFIIPLFYFSALTGVKATVFAPSLFIPYFFSPLEKLLYNPIFRYSVEKDSSVNMILRQSLVLRSYFPWHSFLYGAHFWRSGLGFSSHSWDWLKCFRYSALPCNEREYIWITNTLLVFFLYLCLSLIEGCSVQPGDFNDNKIKRLCEDGKWNCVRRQNNTSVLQETFVISDN